MTESGASNLIVATLAILAIACSSCEPASPHRVHLIVLPDLSKSIETSARTESLGAIETASKELSRGDSLTVIAVTDDAADSAPAEVLRYRYPIERQPFDGDLVGILTAERDGLSRIAADRPFTRTDLFGTIALAREEFAHDSPSSMKAIAVLSDFVEDSGAINFARDKRLRNPLAAKEFAAELAAGSKDLEGISVYLGELPSVTVRKLSETRRQAIRVFWTEYLSRRGAEVEWATDGLGSLQPFVANISRCPSDETREEVLSASR
jgi:hypothetical protein